MTCAEEIFRLYTLQCRMSAGNPPTAAEFGEAFARAVTSTLDEYMAKVIVPTVEESIASKGEVQR